LVPNDGIDFISNQKSERFDYCVLKAGSVEVTATTALTIQHSSFAPKPAAPRNAQRVYGYGCTYGDNGGNRNNSYVPIHVAHALGTVNSATPLVTYATCSSSGTAVDGTGARRVSIGKLTTAHIAIPSATPGTGWRQNRSPAGAGRA